MQRKNLIARILLRYMQNNEQGVYEKKLADVMRSLDVHNYNFNWDRNGCFVEFHYNEIHYRLEHSIEKAKKKGIILRNGLDCLTELIQSLENLSHILDRGINDFETWMTGMKMVSTDTTAATAYQEDETEFETTIERPDYADYSSEEIDDDVPFDTERLLREYEQNRMRKRTVDNKVRF